MLPWIGYNLWIDCENSNTKNGNRIQYIEQMKQKNVHGMDGKNATSLWKYINFSDLTCVNQIEMNIEKHINSATVPPNGIVN